jgi:putative Mn2+ efflux pump MntP
VLALVLVAISLGLSNLAAAVGIGATGVDGATRLRIGLIFGLFEAGMPAVGLLIGRGLAATLGHAARWSGAALLIVFGGYCLVRVLRERGRGRALGTAGTGAAPGAISRAGATSTGATAGTASTGGGAGDAGRPNGLGALLLSGLALSTDNLAVGFALGTYRVGLATGAAVIGLVSVAMSLAGLELGAAIGRRAGRRSELLGGFVLIAAGVVIAAGVT